MESFLKKLANFFEKRRVFVDTIERYFEKFWGIFENMGSFGSCFEKWEFFFGKMVFLRN